jgi:hypothetical protein
VPSVKDFRTFRQVFKFSSSRLKMTAYVTGFNIVDTSACLILCYITYVLRIF